MAKGRFRQPAAAPTEGRDGAFPRRWLNDHRELLIQHSILPLGRENGVIHMAVADPIDTGMAQHLARTQLKTAEVHEAPRRAINDALVQLFREEDVHYAGWSHAETRPDQSAMRVLSPEQKLFGAGLVVALVAALFFMFLQTLVMIFAAVTAFYLISAIYKTVLVLLAIAKPLETPVSDDELAALEDEDLPPYTILVPVYHEANVLGDLVRGLQALDYPKEKLDIKLLLEEDDTETREAADREALPPYFQKLVVPRDGPRGKPRACNYGLRHARGEYCVIFDAEDQPDPDQLKRAIVAFRKSPERTICVQAKLTFFNDSQNILTRWFANEYLTLFDLYLPALNSLRTPIPLGGTSNHFWTDALRQVGGWDPFNVTEDADIGIRVAREGWETRVIDSSTYEEATSQLGNWIRQRSRWIKGYMQTWLVHMRHPVRLYREVGPAGFLGVQVMILGTFLACFINPLMWVVLLLWYLTHAAGISDAYPSPVLYPAVTALLAGNLAFVYAPVMACLRRGHGDWVKYALTIPIYWGLMSIAAWKALYELIFKPHYWQKTTHGITRYSTVRDARVIGEERLSPEASSPVPELVHVSDQ